MSQIQSFTAKMKAMNGVVLALVLALTVVDFPGPCHGELQVGFYKGKCGPQDVEDIIQGVVAEKFRSNRTIVAALLRMQFHDCFVKGCDASILLNGNSTEKTAIPNLSVRGYDIIDAAKDKLEIACPGVVSCADIIVAATRDAVSLSGGRRYVVQTGRKDGLSSEASTVDLPSPTISVAQSIQAFAKKGLDPTDMVLLLGGHTVGVAHCSLFKDRLYNFQGTGKPDPTMDLFLLFTLRLRCPQNAATDNTANLDQNLLNGETVDNSYYKQIKRNRGVLQIDQELALDSSTKATVKDLASSTDFFTQFGNAMVKLGAVEVLTGDQGEIRKKCGALNNGSP